MRKKEQMIAKPPDRSSAWTRWSPPLTGGALGDAVPVMLPLTEAVVVGCTTTKLVLVDDKVGVPLAVSSPEVLELPYC